MNRSRTLKTSFFSHSSIKVAPRLLGKILRHTEPGRPPVAVRITEVEAYLGSEDPASHAFRGLTARNAAMFKAGGIAYVYFTYGMHYCLNVVTGPKSKGQAVLLRAGIPIEGLETIRSRRPKAKQDRDLCNGPAKLAEALNIGPEHNQVCLRTSHLQILDDGTKVPKKQTHITTRIGISKGKDLLYRWVWAPEVRA